MADSFTSPPPKQFEPFKPSAKEPFDERRVGHLMRRAGFGLSYELLESTLKQSPDEAVNAELLDYNSDDDPLNYLLEKLEGYLAFTNARPVQGWWVYRMLYTPRPLQEKIALFWHNHFATSAGKVENIALMQNQIEMFRRMGLGSFRELLVAVGRDPAMLVWLDGNTNRKGKPNENYAREVMELFSLGVGSYSEGDVKELARAFTGWNVEGTRAMFNSKAFDAGQKTIFGKTGDFDSESAVDLLLQQPHAAPFLSAKLLRWFVHPSPTQEQIDHYAARLVASDWQIKPVLREMLASRMFFSDWAYRSKIKSPIELCVGSVLAVGGKVNTGFVRDSAAKMGQNLLYPPNVKGWDGEQNWINASTLLLRFNFGLALATQRNDEFARRSDLEGWLSQHDMKSPDAIITHFSRLLLDGNLSPETRDELDKYMNTGEKNEPREFAFGPGAVNTKVRGVLHLMMSTPQYQLA